MELKNTVEVIEFNIRTTERKTTKFKEYYQAIGYAKSRQGQLEKGTVLIICDINTLANLEQQL